MILPKVIAPPGFEPGSSDPESDGRGLPRAELASKPRQTPANTGRITPRKSHDSPPDAKLQPSGNECISGAVEHGLSGRRIPGNPAPSAEHRAKGRAQTATERQSWGAA